MFGRLFTFLACIVLASATAHAAGLPAAYNVAILDGQNNHDWRSTTPAIKAALERTGRFKVTVLTAPPATADAAAWDAFRPNFKEYEAVISNFTDFGVKPCPTRMLDDLTRYVRQGGALVVVHAATSGMLHYPEYARMVGMGWRMDSSADRLYVNDKGKTIRQASGQGPATHHGPNFQWPVTFWPMQHPVTAGLPKIWQHAKDELWSSPRGPAQDVEVLATAVTPETKQNEPVIWTVAYGKGRVFVTLLGHDAAAMTCVGFQATLSRGAEWAITGKVTQPAPADFPTADKVSTVTETKKGETRGQ